MLPQCFFCFVIKVIGICGAVLAVLVLVSRKGCFSLFSSGQKPFKFEKDGRCQGYLYFENELNNFIYTVYTEVVR